MFVDWVRCFGSISNPCRTTEHFVAFAGLFLGWKMERPSLIVRPVLYMFLHESKCDYRMSHRLCFGKIKVNQIAVDRPFEV